MKSIDLFLMVSMISVLLSSCGNESDPVAQKKGAAPVPKALQEGSSSEIKMLYSRSGNNLVDELYQDLLDNSEELKKLEEDWEKLEESKKTPFEKLENYTEKSDSYHRSAKSMASGITDSILRKKILGLIESNERNYEGKIKEFNSLKSEIAKNDGSLEDHYNAMKIILTIPLIEKYQKEQLPDNQKAFKDILKEQKKLIRKIDSLSSGK